MTEKEEHAYIKGEQAARRSIILECQRHLPKSEQIYDDERLRVVAALRKVCEVIGDNDWPDDLDLEDVITKHIHIDR